ncbi:Mechanosensitive ion channel-domain-containing protein [Phellopilus nigrolimitatus]|nr:Mechanosensitive ion channel-domain-containing protein [Phellopilus nigrolimitatus]
MDEKSLKPELEVDTDADAKAPVNVKPSVHYPDELSHGPIPSYATKEVRLDSPDGISSRAPSLAGTDDDDDDDDYDWSTEDDLVDEEAKKFEKQMGGGQQRMGWFTRIIAFLLSTLIGTVITAGVIVAAAVLVRVFYLGRSSSNDNDRRRYVTQNIEAWLYWAAAQLLISWFLALIINIIPGAVTWVVFIVWGHISESMKSRVELYNSIKGTIKPVFYAASSWLSWYILFVHIFDLYDPDNEASSRASYTPRVYQVVEFFFFFTLVLCLQRMLSHMIAFAFHKTAFKDRLESLKMALKTIDHLKNYKPRHRPERSSKLFGGFGTPKFGLSPYFEKSHFIPGSSRVGAPEPYDDGHTGDCEDNSTKKGKGKQKHTGIKTMSGTFTPDLRPDSPANAHSEQLITNSHGGDHNYPPKASPVEGSRSPHSGTPGRRSSEHEEDNTIVHAAKALKTAVMHDARNLKGNDDAEISGLGWSIGSPHEAKRLARSIYAAFRNGRRHYLAAEDFYPAYATHEQAHEAFRVFDADNNGDISRAEIKSTVVRNYRERRFLSRSMRDVGAALRSLQHVLLFFAFVILFFISLSIFGVEVGDSLTSAYTIGIAASFIFKASAGGAFDAIMFLFVTHPFDTGDRCFIMDENLVVKKMGLFATVFTRADGTETYYFNSQLFTKFITNARRSGKTAEACTLQIAWRTPLEKLDALEKCLNEWLSTEENRWFEPNTSIMLQKIDFQRHLEITIGIPHNGNWQDWGLRNTRKTAFYAAANYYCRQLGIVAMNSARPIVYTDIGKDGAKPSTSPTSATNGELEEAAPADTVAANDLKPTLGFRPPPDKRSSTLLRARKSKGKNAFRSVDV